MQDLQTLGVGLHMDDFGTGYSSLNHLHRYPFDTLKIDRSFIQGIASEKESADIVGTILDLARSLEMDVVAEGIETPEQARAAEGTRVPTRAGILLRQALDPETISAMLASPGGAGCWMPGIDQPN